MQAGNAIAGNRASIRDNRGAAGGAKQEVDRAVPVQIGGTDPNGCGAQVEKLCRQGEARIANESAGAVVEEAFVGGRAVGRAQNQIGPTVSIYVSKMGRMEKFLARLDVRRKASGGLGEHARAIVEREARAGVAAVDIAHVDVEIAVAINIADA